MLDDTNCAPSPSSTSSPPKRQRRPASRKPEPVTLTMVPPATVPRSGHSPDTCTGKRYSNDLASPIAAPDDPRLRLKPTTPAVDPAGVLQTSECESTTAATDLDEPNTQVTSLLCRHTSAPRTVIAVPPAMDPALGDADQTDPAAMNANRAPASRLSLPSMLTATLTVPAPRGGARHVTCDDDSYVARTVSFSPKRHTSSADRAKCSPITVTT